MASQIRNVVRVLIGRLIVELTLHFKHSLKLWYGILTFKLLHNIQLDYLYWHITRVWEWVTTCLIISYRCLCSWADRGGRWCEIQKAEPLGFCFLHLNRRIWLRHWENSLKYIILAQSFIVNFDFCFFRLGFGEKRSGLGIWLIFPDCLVLRKNRNIFIIKLILICCQEFLLREDLYGKYTLQNWLGWLLQFLTILLITFNRNRSLVVFFCLLDDCLNLMSIILSSCKIRDYDKLKS